MNAQAEIELYNRSFFNDLLGMPKKVNGRLVIPLECNSPRYWHARKNIQSTEYIFEYNLAADQRQESKTIVTRHGWDFIATGLAIQWDAELGPTPLPPFLRIRHLNYSISSYSGLGSNASPAPLADYYGAMQAPATAGPGRFGSAVLTPWANRYHVFGDNAQIQIDLIKNPIYLTPLEATISLVGWEICRGYNG
jgi:hypothetical protein